MRVVELKIIYREDTGIGMVPLLPQISLRPVGLKLLS